MIKVIAIAFLINSIVVDTFAQDEIGISYPYVPRMKEYF